MIKNDEFKVGDRVFFQGRNGVVTKIYRDSGIMVADFCERRMCFTLDGYSAVCDGEEIKPVRLIKSGKASVKLL